MATLTPKLTGTPGQSPSYNVGMFASMDWEEVGR